MPDPIQGVGNTSIPVGITTTGQASGAQNSSTVSSTDLSQTAVPPPVDQADVATTQNLLTTIIQIANNAPSVDESKVNALQQQIAAGTYQVDPMAIAKKLMELDGDGEGAGQ